MYEREALEYDVNPEEIDKIIEVMGQGDTRYCDFYNAIFVASFIKNKAIETSKIIEKIDFPIEEGEIKKINGPQKFYKFVTLKHLESKGFKLLGIEKTYSGGQADLIMEKENKILVIECGPCRIGKAISYLIKENSELLIVDLDTDDKNIIYYNFKRGENWDKYYSFYQEKELKKIQEAYDSINKTFKQ